MIKEKEMYTVICDNCGADVCEDQEYSCWNEKWAARDNAMNCDWVEVCEKNGEEDKHYCPDCVNYDDDDNLVLSEERKKDLNQFNPLKNR